MCEEPHPSEYLPILWFQIENEQTIPFIVSILSGSESFGWVEKIFISEMFVFSKKTNKPKKIYAANVKLLWNTETKSTAREKINDDKRFKLPFNGSNGFWDIKKNKSQTISFDGLPKIKIPTQTIQVRRSVAIVEDMEQDEEIIRLIRENKELRQFVTDTIIHQKSMQNICKENTIEMNLLKDDLTELKLMSIDLQEENKQLYRVNRELLSCQLLHQTSLEMEALRCSNYEASLLLTNLNYNRDVEHEKEKRNCLEEQIKTEMIMRAIDHAEYMSFIYKMHPDLYHKVNV
jgi:hypothetical protein